MSIGSGARVGPYEIHDVSPDGQRFLMIKPIPGSTETVPPMLVVVQNWFEELKRLVPAR